MLSIFFGSWSWPRSPMLRSPALCSGFTLRFVTRDCFPGGREHETPHGGSTRHGRGATRPPGLLRVSVTRSAGDEHRCVRFADDLLADRRREESVQPAVLMATDDDHIGLVVMSRGNDRVGGVTDLAHWLGVVDTRFGDHVFGALGGDVHRGWQVV